MWVDYFDSFPTKIIQKGSDNNPCTIDFCTPSDGCQHSPIVLPAVDQCHTSYCDPIRGIVTSEIKCRGEDCTCNPDSGCTCATGKWPVNFFVC